MANREALLIASSEYEDPKLNALAAPSNDAKLLGSILESAVGDFSLRQLINPTSWEAARAVEEFFNARSFDDTLLFYFSGHGLKTDDGSLFFATTDTRQGTLRSTSLPSGLVRDVMKDSGSDRQIVVLDCCYGGAFSRGFKGDQAIDARADLDGFGRVVLTASNSLEFAWQEEDGQESLSKSSTFTRALVEGLEDMSADIDGDGQVTADELHKFARKRLLAVGAKQTPTISSAGLEGELVIGRGKPRRKKPSGGAHLDLSSFVAIRDTGAEGAVVGQAVAVAVETSLAYQGRWERLARYARAKARLIDFGEDAWA